MDDANMQPGAEARGEPKADMTPVHVQYLIREAAHELRKATDTSEPAAKSTLRDMVTKLRDLVSALPDEPAPAAAPTATGDATGEHGAHQQDDDKPEHWWDWL